VATTTAVEGATARPVATAVATANAAATSTTLAALVGLANSADTTTTSPCPLVLAAATIPASSLVDTEEADEADSLMAEEGEEDTDTIRETSTTRETFRSFLA